MAEKTQDPGDEAVQDDEEDMMPVPLQRRFIHFSVFILIAMITIVSCAGDKIPTVPGDDDPPDYPIGSEDTLRVLFIGNSFTNYYDLPSLFRHLAESEGKTVLVASKLINGFQLQYFCELDEVIAEVNSQDWHYVCLQGSGAALAYPEYWGFSDTDGLDCMRALVETNCSSSIPVYFMTWAYKDGMSWVEGYSDDYFTMQTKIFDKTLEMAEERGLMVAPVGWAWRTVVAHRPDIELFDIDNSHPSIYGAYLSACTIFCTLFQETLYQNEFVSTISIDDAAYLQSVASSELIRNGTLYNIVPPDTNGCGLATDF